MGTDLGVERLGFGHIFRGRRFIHVFKSCSSGGVSEFSLSKQQYLRVQTLDLVMGSTEPPPPWGTHSLTCTFSPEGPSTPGDCRGRWTPSSQLIGRRENSFASCSSRASLFGALCIPEELQWSGPCILQNKALERYREASALFCLLYLSLFHNLGLGQLNKKQTMHFHRLN